MSNTLAFLYNNPSITCYAIIRDSTTLTVWNGTAFESWNDSHLASYNIPLVYSGGDAYTVSVPATLPVGNYMVIFYVQSGVSPATGDIIGDSYEFTWNGAAIVPSATSVVLDPYALTTLANVKLEVLYFTGTTQYDDILTQFINEESARFERLTARQILNRRYKEAMRARWGKFTPRNMPVTDVERLGYGDGYFMNTTYTGPAIRCTMGIDSTYTLNVKEWDVSGNITTTSLPLASYKSSSGLYDALVSSVPGISGECQYNVPTDYIYKCSPIVLKDETSNYNAQFSYASADLAGAYVRDDQAIGYDADFTGMCQAIYWAGYTTVPADVNGAIVDAVKTRFFLMKRPLNLLSESIAKYSYSMRLRDYSEYYYSVVDTWRRIVVFGR